VADAGGQTVATSRLQPDVYIKSRKPNGCLLAQTATKLANSGMHEQAAGTAASRTYTSEPTSNGEVSRAELTPATGRR